MSISSVSSAAPTAPLTGNAALQAARAQYLRTGIDKDAAIGDPDHDAPRKPVSAVATPATQTSSSAATVANATTTISTSSAAAAAAYEATAKR
ncbi:hypothetical protein GCM10011611_52470 [Aliidongia dinghuensis]|uniref:Uncharacterized protein n=1 Tax=Aliidongia dinghuensis TaxID=1867774 RepID=A0A8J2YZ94_9PROT|nr:hypothetical protein [Aliidongia dinghuensis]GGF39557.1 hypothetical protein GCM10011611_52470 [Aliidongia dinghuensis]